MSAMLSHPERRLSPHLLWGADGYLSPVIPPAHPELVGSEAGQRPTTRALASSQWYMGLSISRVLRQAQDERKLGLEPPEFAPPRPGSVPMLPVDRAGKAAMHGTQGQMAGAA
jgi:hypothetical protein